MARDKDSIRVHVVDRGRRYLYLRFRDPVTGKDVTKSSGETSRREAERAAAQWEADLAAGRFKPLSRVTWSESRERYDQEVLPGMAAGSHPKVDAVLDSVESVIGPDRLAKMTTERVSQWQASLRSRGLTEATIKSHSATLKAFLRWCQSQGILAAVPVLKKPSRAKGAKVMKGRAPTGEEFDRILAAIPKVVGEERRESWEHTVRGFYWSGLRLAEGVELSWDESSGISIDLSGEYPALRIAAGSENGAQERLLPLAPEAAELFLKTPPEEREGYVLRPLDAKGRRASVDVVMRSIGEFGKRAGVRVSRETYNGKPHDKFASAHDLRRAFGERWALRVMPPVLQELMRHESIETTMRYYVGRNAGRTARLLYDAVKGATSGDTGPKPSPVPTEETAVTPSQK